MYRNKIKKKITNKMKQIDNKKIIEKNYTNAHVKFEMFVVLW